MARDYDQPCPVARTLDVIGERWTLLILRDLFKFGPRRFKDFERTLDGIAPNTLSMRLKKLEAAGVIARRNYSDHPPRADYDLTERGRELGPVLLRLKRWGERHSAPGEEEISA
jgi:DNA-binding HxlR family transcriptional regulator